MRVAVLDNHLNEGGGQNGNHKEEGGNDDRRLIQGFFEAAARAIDSRIRSEHAPGAAVLGLHDNQNSQHNAEDDLGDKDYKRYGAQWFSFLRLGQPISIALSAREEQIWIAVLVELVKPSTKTQGNP